MSYTDYNSGQLIALIESSSDQKYTGIINLKTNISGSQKQRTSSVVLRNGQVILADSQLPTNEQFCKILGDKTNPNAIAASKALPNGC